MKTDKQPYGQAREILRTIPEGKMRITVLKVAQEIASRHNYIDVRTCDMIAAIQQLKPLFPAL